MDPALHSALAVAADAEAEKTAEDPDQTYQGAELHYDLMHAGVDGAVSAVSAAAAILNCHGAT